MSNEDRIEHIQIKVTDIEVMIERDLNRRLDALEGGLREHLEKVEYLIDRVEHRVADVMVDIERLQGFCSAALLDIVRWLDALRCMSMELLKRLKP